MKIGGATGSAGQFVCMSALCAVAALLLSACAPSERASGLEASQAGDPIDNIGLLANVSFVMKGGVIYKQPESPAGAGAAQ